MPDTTTVTDQNPNLAPPSGDPLQAEKYVKELIQLIEQDKLIISHTDLAKFDPSALQDHYSMTLREYHVELSHSKHPESGEDSFVILFTNIKNVADGNFEKVILAYMHLDENQFKQFKIAFTNQAQRLKKVEEVERLKSALEPVDQILKDINTQTTELDKVSESDKNFEPSIPAIS